MSETLRIALVGNPNCGKTTLFNSLTGSNQYVGNWPGVTVERKDGELRGHEHVVIQDLPGIYSLSPYSLEEVVTRDYLVNEKPHAIINIVDGTHIERNLYLTTQLLELNLPMVVAINMMDLVCKNGDRLNLELLGEKLGCPVVPISALTGEGAERLASLTIEQASRHQIDERPHIFTGSVEHAIAHIEESIQEKVDEQHLRWFAVKIFERDEKVLKDLGLETELIGHLEKHIRDCEKELDDDADGIITNQRYASIEKIIAEAVERSSSKEGLTTSDKIDLVVTSRVFALPIFAIVIWMMYYLSVTTVGTWLTDWVNNGIFGEGWFWYGKGAQYAADAVEYSQAEVICQPIDYAEFTQALERSPSDPMAWQMTEDVAQYLHYDSPASVTEEAFSHFLADHNWVGLAYFPAKGESEKPEPAVVQGVSTEQLYEKRLLLERGAPEPERYPGWIPGIPVVARRLLEKGKAGEAVQSMVMHGIIGGVGTVLGFVPQILLVFFFLAFLEDCGYMSRVAFIMDRIFRRFGLSGKSFIPMIVGTGCGVPAIMAARTIENLKDRRMTIMLATFIPCGAKMEVVAMITLAFFPGSFWVAPSMYFIGVLIIILAGISLKKTKAFAGDPAPFVMELPAYHLPTLKNLLWHTWDRGKGFCVKAGTVIFLACLLLWFLQASSWSFHFVGDMVDDSMLASIGNLFAWIFSPLGFGDWKGAVAVISAEFAKEQATGTLGVLAHAEEASTITVIQNMFQEFNPAHPGLAALAFMTMNLFAPPCVIAIITAFKELGSAKWGWLTVLMQASVGYCISLIVYQLGAFFFDGGKLGVGTIAAFVLIAIVLVLVFRPGYSGKPMEHRI